MALELPNDGFPHESPTVLKRNKSYEYPQYTIWRPQSYTQLHARNSPHQDSYREFKSIERTLHFGEYVAERFSECLRTTPLTERNHTHISSFDTPIKGLWFGPVIPENKDKNNWYGNVSIEFNFKSLLENHGDIRNYFVEVVEYRSSIASRILISNKNYDDIPLYDPTRKGGPWYRDENGCDKYLRWGRTLYSFQQKIKVCKQHVLEFILDIGDLPLSGDFGPSLIKAANHSEANREEFCKCKRFRSGLSQNWRKCTSPWSIEETKANLQEIERMIVPSSTVENSASLSDSSLDQELDW